MAKGVGFQAILCSPMAVLSIELCQFSTDPIPEVESLDELDTPESYEVGLCHQTFAMLLYYVFRLAYYINIPPNSASSCIPQLLQQSYTSLLNLQCYHVLVPDVAVVSQQLRLMLSQ